MTHTTICGMSDPGPIRKNYLPDDLLADAQEFHLLGSTPAQVGTDDALAETRWLEHCHDSISSTPAIQMSGMPLSH